MLCLIVCVQRLLEVSLLMPRSRMQHTTALPRGKSCSAYAANSIVSTLKKNFLQTYFRLQKLWNETSELRLIFFSNWLMPFWNPLAANLWWDRHFADRIFMLRHAEALSKRVTFMSTLFLLFTAWQGHISLHFTVRYSVDAP